MAAVCYDVLNQVLFDKTVLSTLCIYSVTGQSFHKGRPMICERVSAVTRLRLCSGMTRSSVSAAPSHRITHQLGEELKSPFGQLAERKQQISA